MVEALALPLPLPAASFHADTSRRASPPVTHEGVRYAVRVLADEVRRLRNERDETAVPADRRTFAGSVAFRATTAHAHPLGLNDVRSIALLRGARVRGRAQETLNAHLWRRGGASAAAKSTVA